MSVPPARPYAPSDPSAYPDPSPSIPRPPIKKKKRPTVSQTVVYPVGVGEDGRSRNMGIGTIVKKDSLGRVMNTMAPISARAGSVISRGEESVAGGSGGGSAHVAAMPYTKEDVIFEFADVPDETCWKYLEMQNLLPTFDGGAANPFTGTRALNPKLLYDTPQSSSTSTSDPEPSLPQPKKRRNPNKRDRDDVSHTADEGAAEVAGKEPKKRRLTNTSMSAAAVLVPLPDVPEEGRVVEAAPGLVGMEVNGLSASAKGKEKEVVVPMEGVESTGEGVAVDAAAGATVPAVPSTERDPTADSDDPIIPPESPPALRRSTRRPATGNSLSAIHKSTRSRSYSRSYSPDEDEIERKRFKPILADVEAVKRMLREKADEDWYDGLREQGQVGGGGAVQVVGMQMGPGGVLQKRVARESEIVVDFLYALKTADRTLKIANQPPSQAMLDGGMM